MKTKVSINVCLCECTYKICFLEDLFFSRPFRGLSCFRYKMNRQSRAIFALLLAILDWIVVINFMGAFWHGLRACE